jgi:hypothetical protein
VSGSNERIPDRTVYERATIACGAEKPRMIAENAGTPAKGWSKGNAA